MDTQDPCTNVSSASPPAPKPSLLNAPPSAVRYDRIESILAADQAFKQLMQDRSTTITRRSGETKNYSWLVVAVTDALHAANQDAHRAPRPLVLRFATELRDRPPNKTSASAKPRPARNRTPATASKTTTKPDKPATTTVSESPRPTPDKNGANLVAVYANVAKLSLLVSLSNLMDLDDDKFPGFEKRRESVTFLIDEYCRLKDQPSPVHLPREQEA